MSEAIYRTIYQIEVFSQGPFDDGSITELETIVYAISEGDCVGDMTLVSSDVVPASEVASELERIGSEAGFFGLDEDKDEEEL